MVLVTMLRRGGRTVGFTSAGHANCGQSGTDVVCAAISALTQTCLIGLTDVVGLRHGEGLDVTISEEQGITCILSGDTGGERREQAELLFRTMEMGLVSIRQSYRKALNIRHREV